MKPATTTDADSRVAPTAALDNAAVPASTPPAEEGRQQYIIRRYRLDTITGEPTFIDECTSADLHTLYGDTTTENRVIVCWPGGEAHTLEVYHCRTPMHAVAMLAVINATEDDIKQHEPSGEEPLAAILAQAKEGKHDAE